MDHNVSHLNENNENKKTTKHEQTLKHPPLSHRKGLSRMLPIVKMRLDIEVSPPAFVRNLSKDIISFVKAIPQSNFG